MNDCLTQERLLKLLSYDGVSGEFTWIATNSVRAKAGKRAGTKNGPGYRCIQIDGVIYSEHRLAWFYVHGEWPKVVDHINGIRDDNRIINLRDAEFHGNAWNSSKRIDNTSGYRGVCWHRTNRKWKVQFIVNGVSHSFGMFEDVHEAGMVADRERRRLHGEFSSDRDKQIHSQKNLTNLAQSGFSFI